ncbi:MAG: hypothetical protein FJY29_11890 [Betaproteobacteria bacterium]|nr:hypothetical protein [Betaproteobacteria bacterium]
MASATALLLALTPLTHEASPTALGLGNEQLVQTEGACGTFCLNSSNAHHDVKASAHASMALIPQQKSSSSEGLKLSPTRINTYDISWHPFYDFAAAAGYRFSSRTTERTATNKTVRRISAELTEIPVALSARPAEPFALGVRYVFRSVELSQENFNNPSTRPGTMNAQPNRWGVDAVWQKDEATGIGLSYLAPTQVAMNSSKSNRSQSAFMAPDPSWTDPQEFTLSLARLAAFSPPPGVTFGPFENVFHGALSVVTWEAGKPVAYSALASSSVSKDGWSLTDNGSQTAEFRFDTIDPSMSLSAGLESLWLRGTLGHVSTYTHVRLNHIASQKEQNQWQGGFGVGLSGRFVSFQAASLWRENDSGFSLGISSSL